MSRNSFGNIEMDGPKLKNHLMNHVENFEGNSSFEPYEPSMLIGFVIKHIVPSFFVVIVGIGLGSELPLKGILYCIKVGSNLLGIQLLGF